MIPGDRDGLHPVLQARLDELHRLVPALRIVDGPRSRAQQQAFWDGYQAKLAHPGDPRYAHFNTAADPNKVTLGRYGLSRIVGGFHMPQDDGLAYAADINWSELSYRDQVAVAAALPRLRLFRPVTFPQWEPWHIQMSFDDWTWTPPTSEDNDVGTITDPDQKHQLATAADLAAQDHPVIGDISARLARVEALLERLLDHLEGGR